MLNSKLNVYDVEWLDLVFENRNKLYGAYELRQNYGRRLMKALLSASLLFVAIIAAFYIYNIGPLNDASSLKASSEDLSDKVVVVVLPPKKQYPAPAAAPATPKIATRKLAADIRVVPRLQVVEEMPTIKELENAVIGLRNTKGESGLTNALPGDALSSETGTGIGAGGAETSEKVFIMVEQLPEFKGGIQAFYKYLSKNLHYPTHAVETGIEGRVIVSFVVEKNGDLSDIKVERGIGGGCDEEAVRVLKDAPAWSPGIQNGRAVRVRYTVPISFNLGS